MKSVPPHVAHFLLDELGEKEFWDAVFRTGAALFLMGTAAPLWWRGWKRFNTPPAYRDGCYDV